MRVSWEMALGWVDLGGLLRVQFVMPSKRLSCSGSRVGIAGGAAISAIGAADVAAGGAAVDFLAFGSRFKAAKCADRFPP